MSVPLADYYFGDSRLVLIPIEHLTPQGVSGAFADALTAMRGWSAARVALFDAGFIRYWERTDALARHTRTWSPPRLRHVAVLERPLDIHPYAPLLNTTAWTLYADDLDPDGCDAEFVAYLLAHGDRMARLGEVTAAALHNAAWWFARSEAECAAFAAAAARSQRPDSDAFRLLAAALPWLRRLGHASLRPLHEPHRAIPDTELQVPRALEGEPPRLVHGWTAVARGTAAAWTSAWRGGDLGAVSPLLDRLAADAPPLLVTARGDRVVWDPDTPSRLGPLRNELKRAGAAARRDIDADLRVVADHTRRFLAALAAPSELAPVSDAEQGGYVYMHRARGLLAYNLDEAHVGRRDGPAIPFARAMLGARAAHEWAHRAVDAGWVPAGDGHAARVAALAAQLDATIAAAPERVRAATAADLAALAAQGSAGVGLARVVLSRMPDFQCNLLAQRFVSEPERETYVRQNVRTLRPEYPAAKRWRMLVRYLYELQYLRFSAVAEPRTYLLRSTWADADLIDNGLVDDARFDALAAAVSAICDGYAVDERHFAS
jgi:hypothetical protein